MQEIVDEAESRLNPGLLSKHESWERVRLGDIANVQNGAAFSSRHFNQDGEGLPLIRIRDVGKAESGTYYAGGYESCYLVYPGHILIGMDGDFRVAIWKGPRGLLNQRVCRLSVRNPELYSARFLVLVLQGYLDAIRDKTSSVTVKHLSSRTVEDIPLPLPPLSEQCRIVAELDDHLSRASAAVQGLRAARMRGGSLAHRLRDQLLEASWVPRLPLKSLLAERLINGRSVPTRVGGFPVLRLTALHDGGIDLTKQKSGDWDDVQAAPFLVRQGDFLVSRGNGSLRLVGRGGLVGDVLSPVAFPDTLIRVRPDVLKIRPDYLSLAWSSSFVRRQIENMARTTAGIYKINQRMLEGVVLPVPNLIEQDAVLARWTAVASGLTYSGEMLGLLIERGVRLQRSLLIEAFAGRLVPQDPDDEPASELLARIKAQRAASVPQQRGRSRRTAKELSAPPTSVTGDDYQQEALRL
ncbi:restriction endonuclease subunit S [Micromonospora okii]|uniref:restriction endonuclease subunit S n=1 Tax=Micromonospora okii TaxID=1182970 RepID=UPI001E477285|nr:restriction endonuclease subunit S [Micromonospora okii]